MFASLVRRNVIFSGIQPTGIPHLGNYLGALSNWVHLQNSAAQEDTLLYSIVGLHAITISQDAGVLLENRMDAMATLLAVGINPTRSIVFHQDEVHGHTELAWILGCITPLGRLNRMTAYKSKLATSASAKQEERLGLFAYPVLQAADILLYKATHVPVGEDQRQHLELTRDLAANFNHQYDHPTFQLPHDIISPGKRILSLRDPTQKMSKSALNPLSRILLTDNSDDIRMKIRKSVTDSVSGISYDPDGRPGVSNLLTILASCLNGDAGATPDLHAFALSYRNNTMSQFKDAVAEAVVARLAPIRDEYQRLRADPAYINQVAQDGAHQAKKVAEKTLAEVKTRMGLGPMFVN